MSHVVGSSGVLAVLAALRPVEDSEPAAGAGGRELLARVQAGEPGALAEFYDAYCGLVHRYVLARLGDRAAAEDITSEVFIRVMRHVAGFRWQGVDPGAWLVTIARNLVLDHAGSARARNEVPRGDVRQESVADPEAAAVERLAHAEVLRCVRLLSADQQEVIGLRFLSDRSIEATAALMGRSPGAVKALQHRALRRLAELLPEGL